MQTASIKQRHGRDEEADDDTDKEVIGKRVEVHLDGAAGAVVGFRGKVIEYTRRHVVLQSDHNGEERIRIPRLRYDAAVVRVVPPLEHSIERAGFTVDYIRKSLGVLDMISRDSESSFIDSGFKHSAGSGFRLNLDIGDE